jgi:hypothetical protein
MNLDLGMNGDFCLRLTFTLLHFLWQGVAIALLALSARAPVRRILWLIKGHGTLESLRPRYIRPIGTALLLVLMGSLIAFRIGAQDEGSGGVLAASPVGSAEKDSGNTPADAESTQTTSTNNTPTFGPERTMTVGGDNTTSDTFIDLDGGRLFTAPPEARQELEANSVFWREDEFNLSPQWPKTFQWIRENGIDAVYHYYGDLPGSANRHRSLLRFLFAMYLYQHDPAAAERLWNDPALLLETLRQRERLHAGERSSFMEMPVVGPRTEGESICPFRTPDGGLGILRVQSPPEGAPQAAIIRYKMLRGVSPEVTHEAAAIPEIRITLFPEAGVYRPSEQLRLQIEFYMRTATRIDASTLGLEIRSADARHTVRLLPLNPTGGRVSFIAAGRQRVGDPNYSLQSFPAGEYLVAATRNGTRCSNVGRFRVDPQFNPKNAPTLELVPLPKDQWSQSFLVGLRAVGPEATDPELIDSNILFPNLIIDGVEHRAGSVDYSGPNLPLKPGQREARIIELARYVPRIDSSREHTVFVKIGDRVSSEVTIPASDTLERLWDAVPVAVETHRVD